MEDDQRQHGSKRGCEREHNAKGQRLADAVQADAKQHGAAAPRRTEYENLKENGSACERARGRRR